MDTSKEVHIKFQRVQKWRQRTEDLKVNNLLFLAEKQAQINSVGWH